jgi:uncharacterized protein (DUF1015 family)
MATIKPFAALRPKPELASQICELPYDVLSADEARAIASRNPLSFFHVSRPEVDLPTGTDAYAPEVYAKGGENFQKLVRDGVLRQDAEPCIYLYRQIMGRHSQTGLVAAVSCEEYLSGVIKKHELTRVDKEDDRVRHIEALNAQTGPVFLAHRGGDLLDKLIAKKTARKPDVDFTAVDGVQHSSWAIADADEIKFIERTFTGIQQLYIADGHHRSAAAARVYLNRSSGRESAQTNQSRLTSAATLGNSGWFLAVIFPHDRMQILPYNRVLKDLNGRRPDQVMEILGSAFAILPDGPAIPSRKHELGFYFRGEWHTLAFKQKLLATDDPLEMLDVSLLQTHVLAPVFGFENPRTSDRIHFVGGIRGTGELEKLVDSGKFACAFSMFPTGMDDLMAVADAGKIMPPKSTWFEPKLRDGMFSHLI